MSFFEKELKEEIEKEKRTAQIEMIKKMKANGISIRDIHKWAPNYSEEEIKKF